MRTSDDENVEPVIIGTTNTVEPDVNNDFQPETQQSPEVSRPTGKKFQQNRRNITTKIGRKNIPPNIPYVSINGINVQCWKYVVQRKTADEGGHVPDIEHEMRHLRAPRMFDTNDWDENAEGFFKYIYRRDHQSGIDIDMIRVIQQDHSQLDCLSVSSRYSTDQFVLGVPTGSHVARVRERKKKGANPNPCRKP
uniref:Uncharacterized protein n=1 Tax=Cucumis melo TaxID=3656 RepID=A0A9I9EK37_CUCME